MHLMFAGCLDLLSINLQVTTGLPKTRSGKIMRRILRQVAANKEDDLGDISTLAEPSVVEDVVKKHKEMQTK